MHGEFEGTKSQRGVALAFAVLVLLFLSLLAASLVVSINVENKVATRGTRGDQALNLAEAGVAEATERLRKGDIGTSLDPESVWQIFLASPDSVPALGSDTVAVATWQEPGEWLPYSSAKRGPEVLTVRYKTDAKRKVIYRYDETKSPAIQTSSGQPIFVISATGRIEDTKRTIVSEVVQPKMTTTLKGAATGARMVQIVGDAYLCGHDHRVDTPTFTSVPRGRNGKPGSCNESPAHRRWEVGSGDIPGAWSAGVVANPDRGGQYGDPAGYLENQEGFHKGPWDMFGVTHSEFQVMMGEPVRRPPALSGDLDGVRYYDADGVASRSDGTVDVREAEGEGFLYVEGDLHFKNDLVYRGLIYATGDVIFDGRAWILGGVVCGGKLLLRGPKDEVAVLYSHDAIAQAITQSVGPVLTLSWREMP